MARKTTNDSGYNTINYKKMLTWYVVVVMFHIGIQQKYFISALKLNFQVSIETNILFQIQWVNCLLKLDQK